MEGVVTDWLSSGTNSVDYFSDGSNYIYHWNDRTLVWVEYHFTSFYQLISPKLLLKQEFKMADTATREKVVRSIVEKLSKPDLIAKLNSVPGGFISMSDGNIFLVSTRETRKRVREDYITYMTNITNISTGADYNVRRFFSNYVTSDDELEQLKAELKSLIFSTQETDVTHVHYWGGSGKNGRQLLGYIIGSIIGKRLCWSLGQQGSPSVDTAYIKELPNATSLNNLSTKAMKNIIVCCYADSKENFKVPTFPITVSSNVYMSNFYFPNTFSTDPGNGELSAASSQTLEKWIDNNISEIVSWIVSGAYIFRTTHMLKHEKEVKNDFIEEKGDSDSASALPSKTDIEKKLLEIVNSGGKIDDTELLTIIKG